MAGTFVSDTIQNGAGASVPTTTVINGSAKAWCNFDGYTGSTATIKGSFNVSSVTYNAAGDYTLNFTTALANTNYTYSGVAAYGRSNGAALGRYICPYGAAYPFGMATTSLRFLTVYTYNSGTQECEMVNVIVHGN
jgi:hypothetical protein